MNTFSITTVSSSVDEINFFENASSFKFNRNSESTRSFTSLSARKHFLLTVTLTLTLLYGQNRSESSSLPSFILPLSVFTLKF